MNRSNLIALILIFVLYFGLNTPAFAQYTAEVYSPMNLPEELRKKIYTPARPLRVLCLDGGGVRGVIPARMLAEIEKRTGKRIYELFDLIVGNSTGGIIALALVTPNKDTNYPKYTADEVLKLYMDNANIIFEESFWRKIITGWGLWDAKYDRNNLDQVLEGFFGDTRLSQTLTPALILSYLMNTAQAHIWISKISQETTKDYLLKDVAGASSAAPTYFAPKKIIHSDGRITYEIDGGIYANNPSTVAIAEIFRSIPNISRDNILLISIGTGQVKFNKEVDELENSGAIGWVIDANLIDVMMNASNDLFEWQTSILNNSSKRMQVILPENLGSMDNASTENLYELLKITEEYITNNTDMLDDLCRKLNRIYGL